MHRSQPWDSPTVPGAPATLVYCLDWPLLEHLSLLAPKYRTEMLHEKTAIMRANSYLLLKLSWQSCGGEHCVLGFASFIDI